MKKILAWTAVLGLAMGAAPASAQTIRIGQKAHQAFAHQWRQTRKPLAPIISAKAQCMLGTAA